MKGDEFHFCLSDFADIQEELVKHYQKNHGLFVHNTESSGENNYSQQIK